MSDILLINALLIAILMGLLWLISLPLKNVSIIDIFWGPGFALIAWSSWYQAGAEPNPYFLLLPVLASLWGLRLGLYLLIRNWGKGEDYRYRAMRERSTGAFRGTSLITVFGLQGLLMWLISFPLQWSLGTQSLVLNLQLSGGVLLWLVGFIFEAGGDWQLMSFKAKAENKGKVLDRGFWRYTRHPNYFGDFLVWWGFWTIATANGNLYWTIFSPLMMSLFLMYVSGVTLLEKNLKKTKPAYAEYVQRTNAFFPWFRRSH